MACGGCKQRNQSNAQNGAGLPVTEKVKTNIIIRLIMFLLSLAILPILIPIIVIVLFNHIVLNKGISLDWIKSLIKKKQPKIEEDNQPINPDDYELLDIIDNQK
jgi:hypothetical protein